jgi:hypothetical protein
LLIAMSGPGFYERFLSMAEISHPRYMLATSSDIKEAQEALKDPTISEAARKQHQLMVDATIHPASGEPINAFVRVASIAPVNIPLIFAMLKCPSSNVPGTLFLHWVNQTYNGYTNYEHRSGKEVDIEASLKAYGLAVVSACGLAYGLGKAAERAPPSVKKWGILIPCLATAAANVSNLAFTRMDEAITGATVKDGEGREHGKSRVAGMLGLAQSACTRAVMVPTACLLLPPAAEALAGRMRLLPKGNVGLTVFRLALIYVSLQGALPTALAVFPQTITLKADELEDKFKSLKDTHGNPIETFYSNKGL